MLRLHYICVASSHGNLYRFTSIRSPAYLISSATFTMSGELVNRVQSHRKKLNLLRP